MRRIAAALLLCAGVSPALAQEAGAGAMDHGAHGHHPEAPAPPSIPPSPPMPAESHAGHVMGPASVGAAPAAPRDYAADAVHDPAAMARARAAMLREHGGMTFSQIMLDRVEYRAASGADGYHWEGEGWIGGDINRFAMKSEGDGAVRGSLERAEVQALYSRALDPWWNVIGGVRQDFGEGPDRTYATLGIEGLAPYWFEVETQLFLSTQGDAHLRIEGSYDQRLTQRLILQPALEVNLAAQDVPELGIGAGLSDIELGLRLRYEIVREFAPYVGFNWERRVGASARYARLAGERVSSPALVIGVRFWF